MLLIYNIPVATYIALVAFFLVYNRASVQSSQIIRKERDEFLNPLCLPPSKLGQRNMSCDGVTCRQFNAVCLAETNGSWCQCAEKLNTYKIGSKRLEGTCTNGKKIMFQSSKLIRRSSAYMIITVYTAVR